MGKMLFHDEIEGGRHFFGRKGELEVLKRLHIKKLPILLLFRKKNLGERI
jgi:hypothetical protein